MKDNRSIPAALVLGVVATALSLAIVVPGFAKPNKSGSGSSLEAQIAHGKYLVTSVAGCADCHTPMNAKGEPIQSEWLKGAKLGFAPIHPMPEWAGTAPNIAGLHGWTAEQAVHLLMTGVAKDGKRPLPPMPQYRMNRKDATAVVAYLKSLK